MKISFESDEDAKALRAFLKDSADGTGKAEKTQEVVRLHAQAEANLKRLETPVRMMLAGEFSSGKSSLANLLIGDQLIPTGVLASPLPPVVFRHGVETTSAACWWAGREQQGFKGAQFQSIMALEPDYIVLTAPNPLLKHVTIFDTPGSSDPDRDGEILVELSGRAEMVIWCTNAVQAWRESERETWFKLSNTVIRNGLLAVTHVDLPSVRHGYARIMGRLEREAGPHFKGILPIETLTALEAAPGGVVKDQKAWKSSGAEALVRAILDLAAAVRMPDILAAREFMTKYLGSYMVVPASEIPAEPVAVVAPAVSTTKPPASARAALGMPEAVEKRKKPAVTDELGQKVNPLAGFAKLRSMGSKKLSPEIENDPYGADQAVADRAPEPAYEASAATGYATAKSAAETSKPTVPPTKTKAKDTAKFQALVTDWQAKIDALIAQVRDHSDLESSGFVQMAGDVVMEMINNIASAKVATKETAWIVAEFQDGLDLMVMMQMETGAAVLEEAATLILQLSRDLSSLINNS